MIRLFLRDLYTLSDGYSAKEKYPSLVKIMCSKSQISSGSLEGIVKPKSIGRFFINLRDSFYAGMVKCQKLLANALRATIPQHAQFLFYKTDSSRHRNLWDD